MKRSGARLRGDAEPRERGRPGVSPAGRREGDEAEQGADPAPRGGGEDLARGLPAVPEVVREAAARPGAALDPQPRPALGGEPRMGGVPLPRPLLEGAGGAPLATASANRCTRRTVPSALPFEPDPAERVAQYGESGPRPQLLGCRAAARPRPCTGVPGSRCVSTFGNLRRSCASAVRTQVSRSPSPECWVAQPSCGLAVHCHCRPYRPPGKSSSVAGADGRLRRQVGLPVYGDGGALVTEDRPAVRAPAHRLEVDDPAVRALLSGSARTSPRRTGCSPSRPGGGR
jgi:hypothetical protein